MSPTAYSKLLRADIARLWGAARLRWLVLLTPILLATAFAVSWQAQLRLAQERGLFVSAERARWLAQGEKDPHSAAHFGVWAVRPASPLAVLAPGIDPYVGLAVWLEAHKRNEMIFRPMQDADPVLRDALPVAACIELVGPVLAILLGFAGFAEDRQRGRLRMALGNGAALGSMLAVRCVALLVYLAGALLLPAGLLGAAALATLPAENWHGWSRLTLWTALQGLYLTGFLLLALAVSLRASNSRTAIGVLLALWALTCVALPRAAGTAVHALSPLPSYQATRARTEREAPVYESAERWEARRLAALKAHPHGGAAINVRGAQLDQAERDSHAVFDRVLSPFYDAVEHQDDTLAGFGWLAPGLALRAAGTAFAGTDFHQYRHFVDAAERYRRDMVNRMNGTLLAHTDSEAASAATGHAFWKSTPSFDYRPPGLADVLSRAWRPAALLFAWTCGMGCFAWRSARRVSA
jgi:ABC-2 type transport system permease protein